MRTGLVAVCLLASVSVTLAANILIVLPFPGRSHSHLFTPLAEELAIRGHNVTYLTALKYQKTVKNLTQVVIPPIGSSDETPNFFKMRHANTIAMALFMPSVGARHMAHALQCSEFKELMNNKQNTFDVVIVETLLCESIAAGLSQRFKAPLIGYSTFMPSYWINYMIGNVAPTSYIPDPFTNLPKNMNFWERAWNFVFVNLATVYHHWRHLAIQDDLMRKYIDPNLPYVGDIIQNTSLLIVNDHFAVSFPRPVVPNLISIMGIHIKPPKPLPKDLQILMDDSKNGVVFFSLGSNLKSADMDQQKIDMFLTAFGKLKETVIWKFEKELPNTPKNVIISDWLPQSDILAHPNLKLFITHGGLLSTAESVTRGVPLVGIPIFGDQPMNMRQSVNAGVGISLDYDELTSEAIYAAVREVIDNPKYKEAALSRSRQLQDKPMSAMDTAVYWVEYVLRHDGAYHLRSAAQDLAWYQVAQLDVLAGLTLLLFLSLWIVKKICCICFSIVFRRKQNVQGSKKKN